MRTLRLSVWAWGGAWLLALGSGCGLATEGAEFFEVIDEGDASIADIEDSGARRDAASGTKDAGVDSGDKPVTDGGAGDASLEGGSDADAEADSGLDGGSDAELDGGDDLDAATPPDDASDGNTPIPDAGEPDAPPGPCVIGTDPCDKDCDGARNTACGGDDCCDGDPNVYPGQQGFFTSKNACGDFDYNCDGDEQKELGLGQACSRPAFQNRCDPHTEGFKGKVPECGLPGIKFIGCTGRTWNGGCESVEEAVIQGCR